MNWTKEYIDASIEACLEGADCSICPAHIKMVDLFAETGFVNSYCPIHEAQRRAGKDYPAGWDKDMNAQRRNIKHIEKTKEFCYKHLMDPLYEDLLKVKEMEDGKDN